MKTWIIVLVGILLVSQSLLANDFVGGLLETEDGKSKFGVVCVDADCENYRLMHTNPNWYPEWYSPREFPAAKVKKVARNVYRERAVRIRKITRRNYATFGALSLLYCIWPTSAVHPLKRAVACPMIPVGVALDVVKFPFLVAAELFTVPGRLVLKRKSKKAVKFLLNPKKQGEVKVISEKMVSAFIHFEDVN